MSFVRAGGSAAQKTSLGEHDEVHVVLDGVKTDDRSHAELSSRETEEQLRLATEAAEVGLWDVDMVSDTLFWPPRVKRMFGISPDVPVSMADFYAGLHAQDRERVSEAFAAALDPERRALYDVEYRTVGKEDSLIRWVAAKGRGIFDDKGRCVRVIGTAIDITTRKRTEERLRAELSANQQLQRISTEMIHGEAVDTLYQKIVDAAVLLMGCDCASLQMLRPERGQNGELQLLASHGFTAEAAQRWQWVPADSSTTCAVALRSGNRVIASDLERCDLVSVEGLTAYRQVGTRAVQSTPLKSRSGLLLGMISTHWRAPHEPSESDLQRLDVLARQAADLIERANAEIALRTSEEQLRKEANALIRLYQASSRLWRIQNLSEGLDEMLSATIELLGADMGNVQILDPTRKVLHIAAQRGLTSEFVDFFGEVLGEDDSACGRTLRAGQRTVIEDIESDDLYAPLRPIARAAGYRAVQSTLLVNREDVPLGVLSTHWRAVHRPSEQELRRLDLYARQCADFIEWCRSNEALHEQKEQLSAADRQKDEFLAMLAHELRNPLAPIRTASEILARTPSHESRSHSRGAVDIIKRQTAQLTRLVDDLLDVSRITHGRIELQRGPVDLTSVIAQAIETVEPQLRAKQHTLSTVLSNYEPLYVSGDHARLVQCLGNVLTNATKYTDPGGQIRVQSRAEGEYVVIEVADNGTGVAPELLPRIFELFVQNDRTLDRSQGGLGVGLAVVKRLIQMHGGEVSARSPGLGHGTTFEIRLPGIARPTVLGAESAPTRGPARRVLIVDDNQDAATSLAILLNLHAHETLVAVSSRQALECVESFHPEVALLDLGLPEIDGYTLAARLRAMPQLNGIRLVALTGYGQQEDRIRTRAAGFDDHLVKPLDFATLERTLAGIAVSEEQ